MRAFLYGLLLRIKLDIRNRSVLVTYYIIPLVFFGFMGAIFSSINPESKETLIQSLTIFGVTMGAFLGTPLPLVELYGSEIKNAYKVGGIPLWIPAVNNFISAMFHLFIVSVIIYFIAPLAYDARIPANTFGYFLSLVVFIMASLSVGTLLGLLVKSTSKLTMFAQAIFLPSLMLSGIMFPASMLPSAIENAGKIFPATMGFRAMTADSFIFTDYLPMFIVFILAFIVCSILLSKIAKRTQ